MDEWRVRVWMLAQIVCAVWVWCSCKCIQPLIHHYPRPQLPTGTTHPPLPLFFSIPHCLFLYLSPFSLTLSTTPSHWFRGFSWERKLTSCWASVTHCVQPQPASVDTAGQGAQVQQCHAKSLGYSTTLKIIYFTDSVGTVADCEMYTFSEKTFRWRRTYLCRFCITFPMCLNDVRSVQLQTKKKIKEIASNLKCL